MTTIETATYRLAVRADGSIADVTSPAGEHWLSLRLLGALDTTAGPDETLSFEAPRVEGRTIEVTRRSTIWEHASVRLVCLDDAIEVHTSVRGTGALTDVHLLAGRSLAPEKALGFLPTGTSFRTLFSPNPGDPGALVRGADEPAVIGVSGDGTLGRGYWFFTPAPLYFALSTDEEQWTGLGVAAPVDELNFVDLAYVPSDRGFSLLLDYQGHTRVDGDFVAPTILVTPGEPDPYTGLRRHRDELVRRGAAPAPVERERPRWWSEPMFCSWGAQCYLSRAGGAAPAHATQANLDGFLAALEANGVVPGTVVIDDKWQGSYGTNAPDTRKWPDLRRWIENRHDRGQHVLLWWKAWDPEGAPPELCVRRHDGVPVALDPGHPEARELLRQTMHTMLGPDGLDADGLKIDFTARTPNGHALTSAGPRWGIALLHELLQVVYSAAKEIKEDALIITHTPHPAFVDVTDMVRLNDMLRLDDPGPMPPVVPQMRYRAGVVAAACPDVLVDTDDWCVPDLKTWREYAEAKVELGVPSLYYATHLDWTGEALEPEDYATLRRTWDEWRKVV
jgi:hypothetical protein